MKKEEQKRLEEEKKEKEKKEKEKRERELLEKEKKEKERIEKEKKEKEILEEEKRRQIQIENERRKICKLKEEKERKEREKKEEEERKKREKERKKLEEKHTKNFPDAISFINEKNTNVEIKLIHLEVEFKNKPKDIEAFDIFGPSKPGYKFIYIENNKYYTVFPFYKFSNRSIIFGIRDTKEKKFIDNNDIEGKHLEFRAKPKQWELNIMRKKDSENIFNILNVPKEINKFRYLKFLNKLNLKNYSFNFDCIREVTNALSYQEILDYIMEIGMNKLSEMLVKILIEKKIDIYHISNYLENYKNTRFKNNFYEIAPELIFSFSSKNFEKEEKNENNEKENNNDNYAHRKCLLCLDPNIPMNFYPVNYQKDLISKTIENLGISSLDNKEYLEIKRNEINKKLSEFNKSQNFHGLKEIICILTDSTVKKIAQLEYGILANIPIIIQGFTSAGKSFLASVASKINKKDCLSTALSEHTTTEDLLGRDVIKDDSSIKFIPGILLSAYKNGKTLILDECDLAKPEILSCILGSMTKNELIICNQTFRKMDGYNIILTMNGEVKGFNEKQRNILTSNILSKFILIPFDEMEKEECKEIFKSLLIKYENCKDYLDNIDYFIEIHQKMIDEMKNKEEIKNNKSIEPIVTLRNLKYCCYLCRNKIHPKIAAEISYIARFPEKKRKNFCNILNKFGNISENKEILDEIEKIIDDRFLFYNETYKKVIYLALITLRAGLHPLLIGERGCGLTTLAKLVASISGNNNYEFLQCSSETSVEDLIGCYQPQLRIKDKIQDLSSYIKWFDGPVPRAGKKGVPIILDNINQSKPQIIECLNPLLEENSKFNNVEYNILEKENEGPIQMKSGFSIIGTMSIEKDNKSSISKALMNRFIAIYIDNDIEINNDNLKIIIDNIGKQLNNQINKINIINNNGEEEEEYASDNESSDESDENEGNNTINEEKTLMPNWYDIKMISDNTISEIKNYLNKENAKSKTFKALIKKISKLALTYERIKEFGFTMKDCDDFIDLKFNNKNEIYKILQNKILFKSKEIKNKFFFDSPLSDSWKMIMSLISSNISNTAIFLQGVPGSGKSCAARHYGAHRTFKNRNPILTINCHRDLKFDYLVGNYNFKNSKFDFIDGPLLTAMKKGECILLDEFDLCSENILINLLPIFKSNINEEIYLKGVPEPIRISPGFLLIATGNTSKEKGRNKISSMILEEINILEINSTNLMKDINLMQNILKNEYIDIYQEDNSLLKYKISAKQISQLNDVLLQDIQFKLSLRQIKCLLERIIRFCTEENYDFGGFKKIPVIYVIISYIVPQLIIGKQKLTKFLEKIDKIMNYNNLDELMKFIDSDVEIGQTFIKNRDETEKKKYIRKGNIYLITNMDENEFPQVALQAYFWIRMSCSLKSESPSSENLLLAGATSYKEYLLNNWLSLKVRKDKSIDSLSLTKNTEIENLIGISSLDDENKLDIQINNLIENAIYYFDLGSKNIDIDKFDEKFKLIKQNKKDCKSLFYLYENIKKLKHLKNSFNKNYYQIGLKTVTSFNLGIVPKAFILGKKLILKGIENPEASVIERLNSILENPRHLIITEDNQEIYNDDKIFTKIYNKNIKSVPLNNSFTISFTSKEVFQVKLSKAFISRLTVINCPSYDNNNYLTMKIDHEKNYEIICKSIVKDINLANEIIYFKKILIKIEKVKKIEFLRFIRWCKSAKNLYDYLSSLLPKVSDGLIKDEYDEEFLNKCKTELANKNSLNYKYIIGISALRSIIDRYESENREDIIRTYFKDYLPNNLFNLLTLEKNNLESCPLDLIEFKGKKYILSKFSGIILEFPENEKPNDISLKNIQWTKSSVDIAEAIIIALISNTILILEGPPGRGKTAISKAIYNYLKIEGDNLKRINFTPSTILEDIFARTIPKIEGENVSTERKTQSLLYILEKSQNSKKFYKYGLILDEINLASDIVLEYLYSYLDSILKQEDYISPDGIKYQNIGYIGVIATMNDAKLSNSRTSLSNSFINRCHSFKLPDYSSNEKRLLAKTLFPNLNENIFNRIMNCFNISQELANKYSDFGGNTFRELLKLKQFVEKCKDIPIDYLLELILSNNIPSSSMKTFQKKTGLNLISKSLNDLKLKIENNCLCFDKFVKYKLINPRKYKIKEHFTIPQKEALMKMMIGLLAERPILLSGDIGTGKTFIVEQLANLIGVNLKVIQFNSETTSLDIIGKLELTINKNKIKSLNEEIKKFTKILIKAKYKKITEFLVESELLDISKIREFLEKEEENFFKEENNNIFNEFIDLKKQIKDLSGFKKTYFNFQLSALVRAMKDGDWVLLDDINFAPQEIEGLMSLLEEEPILKIYENDPALFYTKDKTKIKNKDTDFLIHPNFRLIMTTSKETNVSLAIKSRCLCIQIEPFKEPKDYGELIANNLKYSDVADKNIIDIAQQIGYSFYKLKEGEIPSYYILKNYILSSVNLVNLSKLIVFSQPIDDKKLAQIIKFCIFSAFKEGENKKSIIESFKKNLENEINFEITPLRNIKRSHEFYLKQCELNIFSYYYLLNKEGNDAIKIINEKIKKINSSAEIKLKLLNKDIQKNEILKETKINNLLDNLDSFTLPEIKEYINDIDEVINILKEFLEEKDELHQYFYFIYYLRKFLNDLSVIDHDKLNGIKLKKFECNKKFFLNYNIDENLSNKYAKILIRFKNMICFFKEIIPEKICILELEKCIIALYYKYYQNLYKNKLKTIQNFENYFPFFLLSKSKLKGKIKKWNFPYLKENLKELYNLLKFYDGIIELDITNNTIYLKKFMQTIHLNKKIDIQSIEQRTTIKKNEIYDAIDFYSNEIDDLIIYYYPKHFYNEENILQLLFFFEIFIKKNLDDFEIKKIIPDDLYNFNFAISYYLNEQKLFNNRGEKDIWDIKYNFIDVIKNGYKLLEVISEIKNGNIKLKKGINLINDNLNINEDNITNIIKIIEVINKYFNDRKLLASINDKLEILKDKRNEFVIEKEKNELKKNFIKFKNSYDNILSNKDYKFLVNEFKQIEKRIENNGNKKDYEKNKNILEKNY